MYIYIYTAAHIRCNFLYSRVGPQARRASQEPIFPLSRRPRAAFSPFPRPETLKSLSVLHLSKGLRSLSLSLSLSFWVFPFLHTRTLARHKLFFNDFSRAAARARVEKSTCVYILARFPSSSCFSFSGEVNYFAKSVFTPLRAFARWVKH